MDIIMATSRTRWNASESALDLMWSLDMMLWLMHVCRKTPTWIGFMFSMIRSCALWRSLSRWIDRRYDGVYYLHYYSSNRLTDDLILFYSCNLPLSALVWINSTGYSRYKLPKSQTRLRPRPQCRMSRKILTNHGGVSLRSAKRCAC